MNTQRNLQAGFGRVDITPDFSVGLDGYHNEDTRFSEGVRDPIYITCIAIKEDAETILIFEADLVSVNDWLAEKICEKVCPATGIPAEKIFCGATHNHSGPATYAEHETSARFRELLTASAVTAAKEALQDLAPAEMLSATKFVKGLTFVRHYLMEDGSYAGSNFGDNKLKYIAHAAEADPRLLLLQFARKDKPSIVMMNWQAHNDNVASVGARFISSSYAGQVRAEFEEETGMHFVLVMGAAGNQNPNSFITEERHAYTDYVSYGHKMAEQALETMKELKPVTGRGIVTKRVVFEAPVNHTWDHKLQEAEEILDIWKKAGKKEGDALAKKYDFSSAYHARYVCVRAAMGPTTPVVLNAFRIGDMGFVTTPNDTFSHVGLHVRFYSPFAETMFITGNCRYMANMASYDYRSYEADTSLYAKGTAEKIADKLVDMLESIRQEKTI